MFSLASFLASKAAFYVAAVNSCTLPGTNTNPFFGLPHWWQFMKGVQDGVGGCGPAFTKLSDIFPIGLAIIDILLHIAGFVAVIAIIVAGVSYMAAIGNPEKITSARKSIQNAIIGLAICLVAAQVVTFIGEKLLPS